MITLEELEKGFARSNPTNLRFFHTAQVVFPKTTPNQIKLGHVHCQRLNKAIFFEWRTFCVDPCDNSAARWLHLRALSTDEEETVSPCSVYEHLSWDKWNVNQAPVHRCFLPGGDRDAFWWCSSVVPALLWVHWEYFCPFTSPHPFTPFQIPRLITISSTPQLCLFSAFASWCWSLAQKGSY